MSKIYMNIILTLLAAAIVVIGIAVVNSNDRMYFASQKVLEKLNQMQLGQTVIHTSAGGDGTSAASVANAEFFVPTATQGGEIVRPLANDAPNLNYIITNEMISSQFYSICNSSLAERNWQRPAEFQPLMAESWTLSSDRKSYLIKLRPGIFWQPYIDPDSGKEVAAKQVTAHDFKFFTDVVRDPEVNASVLRVYYKDLEDIEVLDDLTMIVRWKTALYSNMSATLGMLPLPRHFYCGADGKFDGKKFNYDHKRNRMIVGCGAYRLVHWKKNSEIVFERNENYWGAKYGIMPPIKKLTFKMIKHPNTRFQALVAGKLDQAPLTPEQWHEKSSSQRFIKAKLRKYSDPPTSYSYIGYNLRNPLFQDKRVRQALTMLVDRERILEDIYKNEAQIVIGPFAPNSPYYAKDIKPYAYDIAAAKKLLAQSGWHDADNDGILEKDGRKFIFNILAIASHPIQEKMLPLIKESMAKAGIDMRIQTVEWSVYLQRLNTRDFEVCTLGWSSPFDPDPYQIWHSSQADIEGSSNHIFFKNKRADEIIEQLRVTFDMAERLKLAEEFQQIIHEEQPYTFLFAPYSLNAVSERYQNFRQFPVGSPSEIWFLPQQYISGD